MTICGMAPRRAAAVSALLITLTAALPVQGSEEDGDDPLAHCQTMTETAPDDYRSYACFWTVGRKNGLLDEAARMLRALLEEDPNNPHRSAYLATVEMDRGEAETAAELFRQAADGHARLGNATAEAHVRLTFSYLLAVHMSNLDKAEAELIRVRALMDSVSDPSLPGWLAMRETSLANKRLEFGRALRILRSVESEFFPDGPWVLQQLWLNYMGFTMRALGRLDAASRAYRAEAELLQSQGAPFEEAIPRRNLTLLAIRGGDSETTCLRLAAEALEAAVRGRNRRIEAQVHRDLSYLTTGTERLHHAQTALAIAQETEYSLGILEGFRALALARVETDPSAALSLVQESIDLAEEQEDLSQIAHSHLVHAEILRRIAPRDVASSASLRALDITETIRLLQPDPEIRARHFGIWTDPYYDLASYLLDVADSAAIGQAFDVMERMRARTLLDELEAARASNPTLESREIVEERQQVLRQIAAVQRRLFDPQIREQERAWARGRLTELEGDEGRLRENLRRADPSFAVLGNTKLASLEELQNSLERDQAMLLFQVPGSGLGGTTRSWLLTVTRADASIYELPSAAWIRDAVALFSGLLETGAEAAVDGAAQLYGHLLASPIDELDPRIKRLVIVPDRSLHLLPFGALRTTPEADPLGVQFAISIDPSATAWIRLRNRSQEELQADALVLADPEVRMAYSSAERSAESVLLPDSQDLGSLPFARKEAESVGRRVGGNSQMLVGAEASEVAFKSAPLSDFRVIHFAAHAIVDIEEPRRSGILLAPGSETEDGLLQIRELTELDLAGQLVVLSACRTAGGVVLAGEGPMSLARPLFLAGASTVVGSLWPLPDRAAAELFDRFYSHLARGLSVAGAMSETRSDLSRIGTPARAWAGVVVLGDGDRVPFPGGRRRASIALWVAAIAIVAIFLGLLFHLCKTRRQQ